MNTNPSGSQDGYGEIASEDDSIDVGELVNVFFRNKLLIIGTTVLVGALTFFWTSTRAPVFRAQATLLLERDEAAGGVLSELASFGNDPRAAAEMALIKTHSLAAVTASQPEVWRPQPLMFNATEPDFDPFEESVGDSEPKGADPSRMEQMGLGTSVFPYDLSPMAGMWRRLERKVAGNHRLYAHIERLEPNPASSAKAGLAAQADDEKEEPPSSLDLTFTRASAGGPIQVEVVPTSGWLSFGSEEPLVFDYAPASRAGLGQELPVELEAFGWKLSILAVGDFVGERYRVQRVPMQLAIKRLMNSTQAVESERKSNVVYVRMLHSDPHMAAELANVLCKNYIRRSVLIKQKKATQTVTFIDTQLQEQLASLAEAEQDVVELQTQYPETISLSATAEAYVEQLTTLELAYTKTDLTMYAMREALGYLKAGDSEALARLGAEMPNLLALSYIRELGMLEGESLRLDRTDVSGYRQLLAEERLRLKGLREENSVSLAALESGFAALQKGDAAGLALIGAGGGNHGFETYMSEISRLDTELIRQRGTATPTNPLVRSLESAKTELLKQLTKQLATAIDGMRAAGEHYERLIDDYTASIVEWPGMERETIDAAVDSLRKRVELNLASQLSGLEAEQAAIHSKQAELEARLGELPKSELALAKPMRERAARGLIVEFLLTSQQEARITAAATSAAAVLIDPAMPPTARESPNLSTTQGVGLIFGVLLGCGLALLRNRLRGALYSESSVERHSGLPVIGMVPDYLSGPTRSKSPKLGELFVPMRDEPDGPVAEAYRQIRASLRLAMGSESALRTLAVTSCVPREGKTVTNTDLALVFAAAGRRVLLVDCDLRKPKVHKLFGLEREPGFATVVEKGADWRECVHATGKGSVDVLTAGRCRSGPGEILAGADVVTLLDEFIEAYDLVVFDLPPAVVVGDVANFASKLDAMVILYRSGGVPGRLLSGAASRLRRAGANLVGVIMNAVPASRASGGYGYGYGYGYSYGEDDDS